MANYAINFDLLKLHGATRRTFQTRDGKPVTCVIVPIEANYIKETENNCYITLNMWERTNRETGAPEHDQWGNSHAVQVQLPKDVRESMTADERKAATPYLGSAKPLGASSGPAASSYRPQQPKQDYTNLVPGGPRQRATDDLPLDF